jgi:serine/threonine protein kinase
MESTSVRIYIPDGKSKKLLGEAVSVFGSSRDSKVNANHPIAQGCVFRIKLRQPDFEGNRPERVLKVVSRDQTHHIPQESLAPIEALLLGILSPHDHISNVYEAYVHQNMAMVVLNLIHFDRGEPNAKLRPANLMEINQDVDNPPAAASFLSQLLRILWHLHPRTIAHRDLQFSNILITNAGKVVAIDFGNVMFECSSQDVMDVGYEQDWLHTTEGWRELFALGVDIEGRLDTRGSNLPSQDLVDAEAVIRSLVPGQYPEPSFEELASLPYLSGWHLDCPEELRTWPTIF